MFFLRQSFSVRFFFHSFPSFRFLPLRVFFLFFISDQPIPVGEFSFSRKQRTAPTVSTISIFYHFERFFSNRFPALGRIFDVALAAVCMRIFFFTMRTIALSSANSELLQTICSQFVLHHFLPCFAFLFSDLFLSFLRNSYCSPLSSSKRITLNKFLAVI